MLHVMARRLFPSTRLVASCVIATTVAPNPIASSCALISEDIRGIHGNPRLVSIKIDEMTADAAAIAFEGLSEFSVQV